MADPHAPPAAETLATPERPSRLRRDGGGRIGLNLTAMIDVVFLLLVYFMVATEFRSGEEIFRMDLPERGGGAPADPFELDEQPLVIVVASTGAPLRPYSLRLEGPYPQPEDFDALHEFLRSRQIGELTLGGLFEPDHPIVVRPTASTTWAHAVGAFNAAVRARYTNVTFDQARAG